MAVNAEGESTPLEGEKSIIAKNPYGKYLVLLKFHLTVIRMEESVYTNLYH